MTKDTKTKMKPATYADKLEAQQKAFNSMSNAQKKYVGDSAFAYKTFASAWGGKSKADGIKAKCLDCCCWSVDEVRHCPSQMCSLWKYRPYKPKK